MRPLPASASAPDVSGAEPAASLILPLRSAAADSAEGAATPSKVRAMTQRRNLLAGLSAVGLAAPVLSLHAQPARELRVGFQKISALFIAKNRNGATDTLKLTFLKSYTRFENLAAPR